MRITTKAGLMAALFALGTLAMPAAAAPLPRADAPASATAVQFVDGRDWRKDRREARKDWREDRRERLQDRREVRRDWRQDRRHDWRMDQRARPHARAPHQNRWHRHPGYSKWVGQRVPRVRGLATMSNWQSYRLPAPPRGHFYVRAHDDIFLVHRATHRIVEMFLLR